jgi:hypothetical protein
MSWLKQTVVDGVTRASAAFLQRYEDTIDGIVNADGSLKTAAVEAALGGSLLFAPAPSGGDDTTALQAVLSAVPPAGATVLLQLGTYSVPNGGLTCANPVAIVGAGCGSGNLASPYYHAGLTNIVQTSATAVLLKLSSSRSSVTGVALLCSAAPATTAIGIQVLTGAGDGNRYKDVSIRGFNINVDHQAGTEWFMDRCFLYDFVTYGLKVQNVDGGDGGDMGIQNSLFYGGPTNLHPGAGLRYESGGGLRLVGNKFNFRGSSANYPDHCVDIAINDGVSAGLALLVGNSLETAQVAALRIRQSGTTGTWSGITVTGNEIGPFNAAGRAILIDPATVSCITDIAIVGNVLRANNGSSVKQIGLDKVARVTVGGNTYTGGPNDAKMDTTANTSQVTILPGDNAGVGPTTSQLSVGRTTPGSWWFDTTIGTMQYSDPSIFGVWWTPRTTRNHSATYSASITIDARSGDWVPITVTDGTAFTINAPTNPPDGNHTKQLTVEIINGSGGAMGVITWNGAFVFAGVTWANPANTKKRYARFEWNASVWVCTGFSTADY